MVDLAGIDVIDTGHPPVATERRYLLIHALSDIVYGSVSVPAGADTQTIDEAIFADAEARTQWDDSPNYVDREIKLADVQGEGGLPLRVVAVPVGSSEYIVTEQLGGSIAKKGGPLADWRSFEFVGFAVRRIVLTATVAGRTYEMIQREVDARPDFEYALRLLICSLPDIDDGAEVEIMKDGRTIRNLVAAGDMWRYRYGATLSETFWGDRAY